MMTIWKFPISIIDEQTVDMPIGAKILSVKMRDGTICIWAIVDTNAKNEQRKIGIVGTGNLFWCFNCDFLGTVIDGPFVWHVFIKKESQDDN